MSNRGQSQGKGNQSQGHDGYKHSPFSPRLNNSNVKGPAHGSGNFTRPLVRDGVLNSTSNNASGQGNMNQSFGSGNHQRSFKPHIPPSHGFYATVLNPPNVQQDSSSSVHSANSAPVVIASQEAGENVKIQMFAKIEEGQNVVAQEPVKEVEVPKVEVQEPVKVDMNPNVADQVENSGLVLQEKVDFDKIDQLDASKLVQVVEEVPTKTEETVENKTPEITLSKIHNTQEFCAKIFELSARGVFGVCTFDFEIDIEEYGEYQMTVDVKRLPFAVKSKVFHDLFFDGSPEANDVSAVGLQMESLIKFQQYIDEGKIPQLDNTVAEDLLKLAEHYQLDELKELCFSHVSANIISDENVLTSLICGYTTNDAKLKQSALDYVLDPKKDIFVRILDSNEWNELQRKDLPMANKIIRDVVRNFMPSSC